MHISSRAPLLSAAASMDCIWIMTAFSWVPALSFGGARDDLDDAPVLGLGQRAALGHAHDVAFLARALFIVGVQLGGTADVLAVQRVLDLAFDQDRHRLLHLVADHPAFDRAQRLLVLAHGCLSSSGRAGA